MGKRKGAVRAQDLVSRNGPAGTGRKNVKVKLAEPTKSRSKTTKKTVQQPEEDEDVDLVGRDEMDLEDGDGQGRISVQIVMGSYERVLHGLVAQFDPAELFSVLSPDDERSGPKPMADNFLLAEHTGAIRSLAVSPCVDGAAKANSVLVASGSSDERVCVYQLTCRPPSDSAFRKAVSTPLAESSTTSVGTVPLPTHPLNRAVGTLTSHAGAVTAVEFAGKAKLLSAATDSRISITRTRDMSVLATLRAPKPTANSGSATNLARTDAPAGIVGFAVHPSRRMALSVSAGERCLRLWNLVAGRRAGVLALSNAIKPLIPSSRPVGAAKMPSSAFADPDNQPAGLEWNPAGTQFLIVFARTVILFGADCVPQARIVVPCLSSSRIPGSTRPPAKIQMAKYVRIPGSDSESDQTLVAVSTDDGRIVFFSPPTASLTGSEPDATVPDYIAIASFGGSQAGISARIKAFDTFTISRSINSSRSSILMFAYACSDGQVGLVAVPDMQSFKHVRSNRLDQDCSSDSSVGFVEIARRQTGNRITCLAAFEMSGPALEDGKAHGRAGGRGDSDSGSDSDSDSEVDESASDSGTGSGSD